MTTAKHATLEAPTRRCRGKCGRRLPLDHFRQRKRVIESRGVLSDGGFRIEISGKCKKCQRLYETEKRESRAKPIKKSNLGWDDKATASFLCRAR